MNRRKFLSVGSISFIGINSFGSTFTSFLPKKSEDISSVLLHELDVKNIYLSMDDYRYSVVQIQAKNYLDLGYKFKNKYAFTKGEYLFINLELKSDIDNLDEVILIFNMREKTTYVGAWNKAQMQLLYASKTEILNLEQSKNADLVECVCPIDHHRVIENGYCFYKTKNYKLGYITHLSDGTLVSNIQIKDHGDRLIFERKNDIILVC